MKRFALLVIFALVGFMACRGSVDRVFDEPTLDGGVTIDKKNTDDGGAPLTAPARISGTVLGLVGAGLVLRNNGGDELPISAGGAFTFPTMVNPGQPYAVTVATQPTGPTQTCTVTNGAGTAAGADVTNIQINCVIESYSVGGTVIGLTGALVLQNNGANDITIPAGAVDFAFVTGIPSGANFNVTVKSGPPGSNCNVSGGTGTVVTADVDTVVINCAANSYTIGGTVSGLAGTLVVQNVGANDRTISANGSFAFSIPVTNGKSYAVTIKSNPTSPVQTCTIANGTGVMAAANVTNVAIVCTTTKFTVGGTITGLTTSGLILENKGTDDKAIPAGSGPFTFATPLASGTSYTVSIKTQPSGQTCTLQNPSGTVTSANVTSVGITCSAPVAFQQNFDSVAAPALPQGWTMASIQAVAEAGAGLADSDPWQTATKNAKSLPNCAFIQDKDTSHDVVLTSPAFTVGSATAKLSFYNQFSTEAEWDGGVLEISIGGGAWTDFVAAGGAFTNATGYNVTLLTDHTSELGGRQAWSGKGAFVTTGNFPASVSGKSVQLRWRWGSDDGASDVGWSIDDIVVTN